MSKNKRKMCRNYNYRPKAYETLNTRVYNMYLEKLLNMAINVFEWHNLPTTIDPRYLELTLIQKGVALFFKDNEIGYLALNATGGGPLNLYSIPIIRRAFASNGYQSGPLTPENSVFIWNNYLHTPSMNMVELYASKLANMDRTIDINLDAQKTPIVLVGDESQRLAMENMFNEYSENKPVMMFEEGYGMENNLRTLSTGAEFVAPDVFRLKRQILNEFLANIGVESNNNDKRERQLTDEMQANLGEIEATRNVVLNARQDACDEINRIFGLNVSVTYRSNLTLSKIMSGEEEDKETPIEEVET